jgi:carboxyl-terminal processing protease
VIAHISLNIFGETTTEEFKKELLEVQKQGVSGIILDLRDNGGGYLQSAVEILSEFIPDGEVVVETRYRDSYLNNKYYSVHN